MKLQSILLPQKETCDDKAMYFHREGNCLIFDGYFNLFYLEKHHKYSALKTVTLELKVNGVKKVMLMHDKDEIARYELQNAGFARRLSFDFPYKDYEKGVFYFKLELTGDVSSDEEFDERLSNKEILVEGFYNGRPLICRDVKIAVNICTYKREAYVTRNMKTLLNFIEERDIESKINEVAENLKVFIIDNGQTLADNKEFQEVLRRINLHSAYVTDPILEVIPNANTGGTGGFSRGMLEAMNRRKELSLTHILMMDDDAVFDPDLFVRLYGFLTTLKDEHIGMTVGGALWREDYRYIQHAAGEWFSDFKVINKHPLTDMRDYETCTADWMTTTENEKNMYGAWWCCCYNMDAITKENLPLPVFVHHDDIQFGMGQRERGIVFLNGIGVWHQGFETAFPGVKQYYNMRNTLITMQMFEPDLLKEKMWKWTYRRYIGMLINYRYADCEFVYRGLMDFLRGKKWLYQIDTEALHKELMAIYKKVCPLENWEEAIKKTGSTEVVFPETEIEKIKNMDSTLTPDELRSYYDSKRFRGSLFKKISFNGWFLPGKKEIKVITPLDSPWATYRHKYIFLYEPATKKGVIVSRSNREFFKGMVRLLKMHHAIRKWINAGLRWE